MKFFDFFTRKKDSESEVSNSSTQTSNIPSSYKIVHIFSNNYHGYPKAQCLLIFANDVNLGHRERCDQTINFLLPQSAWNQIVSISNYQQTWVPNMSDFTLEELYFPGLEKMGLETKRLVWKHRSVPGNNGQLSVNENDIDEIPGWEYKLEQLESQYYDNGWNSTYPSFKSYVNSLAIGDDVENFWGWLFDNDMLSKYDYWTLPNSYKSLFKIFLSYCDD